MPDRPMPGTVKIVVEWLQAQATVNDVIHNRASYRLTGTYPAIRIADLGPMSRGPEEQLRRVQIECWANDYDTAEQLAAAVESVLPEARGQWSTGYCAGGSIESGPYSSPDPTSARFRHQLDVALWLYPPPA